MQPEYKELYEQMLADLACCDNPEVQESDKVESCFWIANKCWEKLKHLSKTIGFSNELEEIEFFKTVKPAFTSQIEYFLLISEALVCVPEDFAKSLTYWYAEQNRYNMFRLKNLEFIRYYESGDRSLDKIYFTRQKNLVVVMQKTFSYETDVAFSTPYDPVVRTYLAYKKYYDFISVKLDQLFSK